MDPFAPVKYLETMFQFLIGYKPENVKVSAKWDGSPAFVCGEHPEDGVFFVGTKSAFTGKACRTNTDIDRFYGNKPELVYKLKELLWYLHPLEWKGVVQGDLLWTTYSLLFDGDAKGFSFQPNCLKYHQPFHRARNIGVVVHTTYTGETFEDMEAQFGAVVPYWMGPDAYVFQPELEVKSHIYHNLKHTHEIQYSLIIHFNNLNKIAETIARAPEVLEALKEPKAVDLFYRYTNHIVKCPGEKMDGAGFLCFIEDHYNNHILGLKTKRGINNSINERENIIQSIHGYEVWYLDCILSFYEQISAVKTILINYLDYLFAFDPEYGYEIHLPNGTLCGHEGYVLTIDNKPAKFVKRQIFSKANFDMERDW
jgi:hypothetical protein